MSKNSVADMLRVQFAWLVVATILFAVTLASLSNKWTIETRNLQIKYDRAIERTKSIEAELELMKLAREAKGS